MNSVQRKRIEQELQFLEKELKKRGTSIPPVSKTVRHSAIFMSYLRELLPAYQADKQKIGYV